MTRAQTQQTLRQLPVKWALALLALIVVYAFAQPALNSRLGWNLPSLARMMGEPEPKKPVAREAGQDTHQDGRKTSKSESSSDDSASSSGDEATKLTNTQDPPADVEQNKTAKPPSNATSTKTTASSEPESTTEPKPQAQPKATADRKTAAAPKTKPGAADSALLYGILKETGRDRYVSVEGLQYNPGSEEGHRLKHLERHLHDMPDRPGKHGVFDGEMKDALKWIDDAYARGQRGAKGVRKSDEENRTVYEVPFSQPIGYIGGRDGKRTGNPPAKRIRLVVEGNKFITAFPF